MLDIGLSALIDFNYDPVSGDVTSLSYVQNDNPAVQFDRIRHDGSLSIAMSAGLNPIQLTVEGEGDREYPLECSTDLQTWLPLGTIDIWAPRQQPIAGTEKYFRIIEP